VLDRIAQKSVVFLQRRRAQWLAGLDDLAGVPLAKRHAGTLQKSLPVGSDATTQHDLFALTLEEEELTVRGAACMADRIKDRVEWLCGHPVGQRTAHQETFERRAAGIAADDPVRIQPYDPATLTVADR